MIPGRLISRREFTPVPSYGSAFVYMIPPQNVMLARVHPGSCAGARFSSRHENSFRCHENTVWLFVSWSLISMKFHQFYGTIRLGFMSTRCNFSSRPGMKVAPVSCKHPLRPHVQNNGRPKLSLKTVTLAERGQTVAAGKIIRCGCPH